MGGVGSGGSGRRLSDEERRRRGTFRPDKSDAIRDAAAAARVVSGPWLASIPESELPLDEIGKRKYYEIARILFDQGKLTSVTREYAEQIAVAQQEIHRSMTAGKPVRAAYLTQKNRALQALKIAEDAPAIANPGARVNKFKACGFSNRRDEAVRLRGPAASRS